MNPSKVASELRRIADRIDASKKPSRRLVVSAIKKISSKLEEPLRPADQVYKNVYSLWPDGEQERIFDVEVWEESAGSAVRATLKSGPAPTFETEGLLSDDGGGDAFLEYILRNATTE